MPFNGGGSGGGAGSDTTAIHDNEASEISAITLKSTPVSGDLLLIEDSAAANVKKRITVGSLPGGGGESVTKSITQASHGLVVGNVVRFNGTNYVKGQADSAANAEVVGIVDAVADTNTFTLLPVGYIDGLSSLTAGTVYFLDPSTAGALTATEPSTTNQISKPLLVADTTTSGWFVNMRGTVIGGQSNPAALVISGERILTGTTTYTVDASGTDYILLCDALLGPVTVTLPASPTARRQIVLKDATGSATTANITIQQSVAETIDGATSVTLSANYQSLTLRANADGNWSLI